MIRPGSRRTLLALATGLAVLPAAQAQGSDFPTKPVTIIVPYPAGGIVESVTRVIAGHVSKPQAPRSPEQINAILRSDHEK